jgi:hypothetical protein
MLDKKRNMPDDRKRLYQIECVLAKEAKTATWQPEARQALRVQMNPAATFEVSGLGAVTT